MLPGFIDAHTHLTMDFEPDYIGARKTLMTGFTTVRDVGSSDFLDVGLRNSIDAGAVHGHGTFGYLSSGTSAVYGAG